MNDRCQTGWVTDESGYRYDATDPITRRPWPPMPEAFSRLAVRAAAAGGFVGYEPDASKQCTFLRACA